jgi:hypothetical protein
MQATANADYKIKVPGFVSVCCVCFPNTSIVAKYPELTGMRLSHGYCATCAAKLLAELKGN